MAFAALTAAIVASLAGKANSIATIFSMDIYRKFFHRDASERRLVLTGRWAVVVSMGIASLVAPALRRLDQAYQFIQEYVGFIAPGVLAIFLLGLFWKRATSRAALAAAVLTIPLSTILKYLPYWTNGIFPDYAFLDRMSIVFVTLILLMTIISWFDTREKVVLSRIKIDTQMFRTSPSFVAGSVLIIGILTALYSVFW